MLTLCSTVVVPTFANATVRIEPLTADEFRALLPHVQHNLCGHPVTQAVLTAEYPGLPQAEKAFWNGDGVALAARPRGGVRGGAAGDTQVAFTDLEFCKFWIETVAPDEMYDRGYDDGMFAMPRRKGN